MMHSEQLEILPTFGAVIGRLCERRYGFGEPADFARDTLLGRHGAAPSRVYWIEAGIVKKVCLQPDGSELITGLRTSGWIVGAAAALDPARQEPIAITATKCILRPMPVEAFVKAYKELPVLARHVTEMLAIELALRLRISSSVRQTTIRMRLEQFIAECDAVAATLPKNIGRLQLKQVEIAQIVGSTQEHLSRLLHQMELEGALDRTKPPFGAAA